MLNFIANPRAGGKHGKKIRAYLNKIEKILTEKNIEYTIHLTKAKGHATELTKMIIESGSDNVIVVGGDGSLHEVINGFSNFDKVSLGIIPCGTGNDFASALGLSLDPEKALDVILKGEAKYTDFMQMPTVRGLNIIGMGVDVQVLQRYEAKKKKTKWQYTMCLIKTLFNFTMSDFKAKFNEEEKEYTSFIACIANGYRYGGGIPICPPANPTDKKLNFVAVDEIRGLKIIPAFLKLKKGKLLKLKEAHHYETEKVSISPKGDYIVNVDGELYPNIPFEVSIVSDTLRVFRP